MKRGSGVLLHITSLPGPYGSGDFGPSAYTFVDFLKESGQAYWQFLPFNPTDSVYGNSPYSSYSAFAINPLFISPQKLLDDGWLKSSSGLPELKQDEGRVDYLLAEGLKAKVWDDVLSCLVQLQKDPRFRSFVRKNAFWLNDFSLFFVLKECFSGRPWHQWPEEFKFRKQEALEDFRQSHQVQIERVRFQQFLLFDQWQEIYRYCRTNGVAVIGDLPIYVNYDSADVWSCPEFFDLDERLDPQYVAGVPPDYFSKTGQRWGNPLYNWTRMRQDKYHWWVKRFELNFQLFDFLRVDHFRGFVGFWQIPVQEETAVNGQWIPGPGADFFQVMKKHFHHLPIIAEDLGVITDDVRDLIEQFAFPGMRIFLFGLGGDQSHPYLPRNYPENCVAYTGTHDNNTVQGWLEGEAAANEKKNLEDYFQIDPQSQSKEVHWLMIESLMRSKAEVIIVPFQDLLGLGKDARMNTPGQPLGNWQWRVSGQSLSGVLSDRLKAVTSRSHR